MNRGARCDETCRGALLAASRRFVWFRDESRRLIAT